MLCEPSARPNAYQETVGALVKPRVRSASFTIIVWRPLLKALPQLRLSSYPLIRYNTLVSRRRESIKMPNQLTGDPNSHDVSEFSKSLSGSCLCGSITVTINDDELFTKPRGHLCHCANCRKVAGSYVSSNLLIEGEKVKITDRDGTLKTYEDYATGSGNAVYRSFCSKDGKYVQRSKPV